MRPRNTDGSGGRRTFAPGEVPERPTDPAVRRANLRRVAILFKPYRRRLAAVLALIFLSALLADLACQEDEERYECKRKDRQAPVEQEHRDDGRCHRRHVRDDRRRCRRDDPLHAADVVCDPRLHLAGARAREEGEREPL